MYLGLAQTCRELRKESMPLHQARVTVLVLLSELALTYLSPHKVGISRVRYSTGHSLGQIRDLIVLATEEASVFIDFVGSSRYSNDLSRLLSDPRLYPAFCAYIKEHADSVLALGRGSLKCVDELLVEVKPEFSQEWMKTPKDPWHRVKLEDWRAQLGLPIGVSVVPTWPGPYRWC